jgi:hypothetical protein
VQVNDAPQSEPAGQVQLASAQHDQDQQAIKDAAGSGVSITF